MNHPFKPSLDLHPSRDMVASGQRAGRTRKTQAHIRIWSIESLLTLYVFGMGEFEVGVSAVAFSQLVIKCLFKYILRYFRQFLLRIIFWIFCSFFVQLNKRMNK